MKSHAAAGLFPHMTDGEYAALKADIDQRGLLEPIVTYQKQILDGRHRFKACEELRIRPRFVEYEGEDPTAYVISLNLHRRHLSESQRAMVAAKLATMGQGKPANLPDNPPSQAEAAQLLNVGERSVRAAAKVRDHGAPELIAAVESGEVAVSDAAKIVDRPLQEQVEILGKSQDMSRNLVAAARRLDVDKQRTEIESGTLTRPEGVFDVIVIDPPWPYRDGEDQPDYDPKGHRASNPYPEMDLNELSALLLPAADDAVLWLWTTHKFMRHAFPLLDAWGFRERAILTWAKDRMGLGRWLRSQSEFCIMATRGRPLIDLTNQTTVLQAAMREHSRKPDEFYAMVEGLCPGRKLDWFSREPREGWEQYGNDTGKFNAMA